MLTTLLKHSTLVLMALIALCSAVLADEATVYSKEGVVEFKRPNESSWTAVEVGQKLNNYDSIRTAEASRAGIAMSDGVLIRLNERSNFIIELSSTQKSKVLSLTEGAAHFFSRKPRDFPEIHTTLVTAAIRGTEFVVFANPKLSTISVLTGVVQAYNQEGKVTLSSGEEAHIEKGKAPKKSILVNPTDAVQWALYYPAAVDVDDLTDFIAAAETHQQGSIDLLRERNFDAARNNFQGKEWYDLVGRALISSELGNSDEALSLLQTLKEPRSPSASLLLAAILLERGQVVAAEKIHQQILTQLAAWPAEKSSHLARLLSTQQAIIALAQNRKTEAHDKALQAYQDDPKSLSATLAWSYVLQAEFDLDNARKVVETALMHSPHDPRLQVRHADLLLSFGDSQAALTEASAAASGNPSDSYAQTIKGFAELARGETDSAKQSFERAAAQSNGDGLPFLGLGLAQIRGGDLKQGRLSIQQAAHLEPTRSLYRSYLGKALFEEEEENLADEEFNRAIVLDPKDPTPYLYRAFQRVSQSRPVEALDDTEQSIALNDNRGIYRSRLLLDQDSSVRSSSLAQIYGLLGFQEVSRIEAIKSLSQDYSNYSAHLLLAQSYEDTGRLTQAGLSEGFIARLLSPVNFNLVRPNQSGIVSSNEYTALFDREIQRTSIGLNAESKQERLNPQFVFSGTTGKWGYALDYERTKANGYRNNDTEDEHSLYGTAQYQLTPDDTLLFDANFISLDDGETTLGFDPLVNDADRELTLDDYFFRLGFNHRFHAGNQLIGQVVANRSDLKVHDPTLDRLFLDYFTLEGEVIDAFDVAAVVDQRISFKSNGLRGDLQHIYTGQDVSNVFGAGVLSSNQKLSDRGIIRSPEELAETSVNSAAENTESSTRIFNYLTLHAAPWLDVHAGVSFARLRLSNTPLIIPFSDDSEIMNEWDPKIGVVISPTGQTTIRAAYFESVGSAGIREFELIEPTVLSGFNQTFFDIYPGTTSRNTAVGIDQKFSTKTYVGVEALHREVIQRTPITVSQLFFNAEDGSLINEDLYFEDSETHVDEDLVKTYLYQVLNNRMTATFDYLWSRDEDHYSNTTARSHRLQFASNYFHPSGFLAFARATWRTQRLEGFDSSDVDSIDGSRDFWIVDYGVGYRFPKRHGQINLTIQNLFDQKFNYIPNGLEPVFLPGIGALLSFSYNF